LHRIALALALTLAAPAMAEVGRRPLRCEVVTEAPGCQMAASLWNFTPSGGMIVLGDTLRLAGTERISPGPDRAVILDLSLATGAILATTVLETAAEAFRFTTFSPDGQILLAAAVETEAELAALRDSGGDDPGQTTLHVFDATGAHLSEARGYVPTAMLAAFAENRLVFDGAMVSLDLRPFPSDGPPAIISLRYSDGQIGGADLIPDGQWLYEYLFDRDGLWRQGDLQVAAVRSGDGRPAAVWLDRRDSGESRAILRDANEADDRFYDLEFQAPVLSPDGRYLAVLQVSDLAPSAILQAIDVQGAARPFWKAAARTATADDPGQSHYRWTIDGRLVVLHPTQWSRDYVLTVFSPLP
jgi:hypothetical protein